MSLNQHQREVQRRLQAARNVDQSINLMNERIARLKTQAISMNMNLSDMPSSPNRNLHKLEDLVVDICDMEVAAENELKRLVSLKKEAYSYIYQVQDHIGQILLERRYINDESCETISKEVGYSIRNVRRTHDRAIDKIKIEKRSRY